MSVFTKWVKEEKFQQMLAYLNGTTKARVHSYAAEPRAALLRRPWLVGLESQTVYSLEAMLRGGRRGGWEAKTPLGGPEGRPMHESDRLGICHIRSDADSIDRGGWKE